MNAAPMLNYQRTEDRYHFEYLGHDIGEFSYVDQVVVGEQFDDAFMVSHLKATETDDSLIVCFINDDTAEFIGGSASIPF